MQTRETSQYDPMPQASEWSDEALDRIAADVFAETTLKLGEQSDAWLDGWYASQLECVSTIKRAYRRGVMDAEQDGSTMLGVAIIAAGMLIVGIVIGVLLAHAAA